MPNDSAQFSIAILRTIIVSLVAALALNGAAQTAPTAVPTTTAISTPNETETKAATEATPNPEPTKDTKDLNELYDIAHAPADHSNQRRSPKDYAVWEIHPVMKIEVIQ
jgi:hypothetical protein